MELMENVGQMVCRDQWELKESQDQKEPSGEMEILDCQESVGIPDLKEFKAQEVQMENQDHLGQLEQLDQREPKENVAKRERLAHQETRDWMDLEDLKGGEDSMEIEVFQVVQEL